MLLGLRTVGQVLFPALTRFGVPPESMQAAIVKRGFYPQGKGELVVRIAPVAQLQGIELTRRGQPLHVRGVLFGHGTGRRCERNALV